ncbi:hypothetical protein ABZS99_06925 [Streptomyces sp. NPDC005463]|uniref:hypothetical protein n=1 Tax=Streptomyces sp. NPDC005463 TaxID=3154465 RepID=UPI0033B7ED5E
MGGTGARAACRYPLPSVPLPTVPLPAVPLPAASTAAATAPATIPATIGRSSSFRPSAAPGRLSRPVVRTAIPGRTARATRHPGERDLENT